MTRLLLVRHGETGWNREGRYQGHTDTVLNDAGRKQAAQLAARFAGDVFDAIYSSDLKRAYELNCMTLLASNVLLAMPEDATQAAVNAALLPEIDAMLDAYARSTATWLIVSNEVGMGLVPPNRLGRLYRDALGTANQRLAQAADVVLLFVAGLPWALK